MKKHLFVLMLLAICSGSWAQDKLFNEAIQRGRNPGQFYMLDNQKGKSLKLEDLNSYCAAHNYITGRSTTKKVSRFGDVAETISTFEFLPMSEFETYMYYHMRPDRTVEHAHLVNKGSAYCFLKQSGKDTYFWRCNNISWSGQVTDGKLDGSGVGFGKVSETLIVCFYAKFDKGMPVGKNSFQWYFLNGTPRPFASSQLSAHTATVYEFHEGLAAFETNNQFGFIDESGKTAVSPTFVAVTQGFTNGKAIVKNDKEEIVIDRNGHQLDLSDRQKQIYTEEKAAAEAKAEAERIAAEEREIARKKAEEERRQAAIKAEERRIDEIRNAIEGDRIVYCQDWKHTEYTNFLFWRIPSESSTYKMKVICFVEKNVNNGERLQVRVASVDSSDDRYYNTPIIDGIKVSKGDVIWIRPLNNSGWWME